MYEKLHKPCFWLAVAVAVAAMAPAWFTQDASAHGGSGGGGGGAGERGSATHQHLDSRFSHDRYYYDRGYAVHRPPRGGLSDLIGPDGEHYYFQGGNWFLWRGDWYRSWGGAWVVVDAPVGMLVPSLPPHYTTIGSSGTPYYYANDTYYVWNPERSEYQVVAPPPGQTTGSSGRGQWSP
ncbi:MAG: hypothetical protein JO299_17060 [Gammaproteobacteria bacterium]|nr:hypothetical protein [Gammaproteobacteria bacterium]